MEVDRRCMLIVEIVVEKWMMAFGGSISLFILEYLADAGYLEIPSYLR